MHEIYKPAANYMYCYLQNIPYSILHIIYILMSSFTPAYLSGEEIKDHKDRY